MATLRERIETIGIDLERAEGLVRTGWYRVDGEIVTDLDADTPDGSRVNGGPAGTDRASAQLILRTQTTYVAVGLPIMDNCRVHVATAVLTLLTWAALFAWLAPIPDGLMVLALAGAVGASHFAALAVFDDGTA